MSSPASASGHAYRGSFVWSVPQKSLSVHLDLNLMHRMQPPAWSGPRPFEVGGVLLGRVAVPQPGHYIVGIDDFAAFECEHVRGESWILSKSDKQSFARFVAKLSKPRRDGRTVVGWFRTHTRPGIFLDQHDFELFGELFPAPSSVALLVRPGAEGAEAGFFFWEDGNIERTRPYLTFDFRPEVHSVPALEAPVIEIRPAARTVSSPLAPMPLARRLARAPGSSSWKRKALLWTPIAAGLLAGLLWHPEPLAPPAGRREAQRARTESTPDRPVFVAAVTPPAAEVAVPETTPLVAQAPREKLQTRSRTAPRYQGKRLQPEMVLASRTAKPAPQLYSEAPSVSAQLKNDPLAQLVKTPELPHAVATVEADRGSALRRVVGTIPGLGFLKKKRQPHDFTPAKAVREVRPASPVPLPGEVPVRVRLSVGRDGRVVHAELVGKRVDARLAQSALEAAREWQFEPARVDEKAVDTEVVVQFRFVPSSESL